MTLKSGDRVRYSLIQRPETPVYNVRFKGPDGRWLERSTKQGTKPRAIDEAHRIIMEEYLQIAPTSDSVTWAVAKGKLEEAMRADGCPR